jgi:thiamine biosynthesis lipoprotein
MAEVNGRRDLLKKIFLGGSAVAALSFPLAQKFKKSLRVFQERRKLMGTWVSVTLFADQLDVAQQAMAEAFFEMTEVDRLMSIHRKDSQISQINKLAGQDSLVVDPRLIEVLKYSKRVAETSLGLYDPTILPVMNLFGFYGHSRSKFPTDAEIHRAVDFVGFKNIVIDEATATVGLSKRGAALDLGSIGKGYALDRAVVGLRRHGIESALVDAGGNLFAMGAPYGDSDPKMGWTVGLRNPHSAEGDSSSKYIKTLVLRDQAVGTSGVDQTMVKIGTQEIGHLFNAVTGRPVHEYASCSPVTRSGIASDALSTAGYILGREKTERLFGQEAEFYFFT